MSRALDVLARAFAFAGGVVLVAMTGMSVVSIAGR
ncbi:MAG: TRAP transporter small permease, partial [Candidatus Rokuibacteriota bacterium]